MRTQTYQTALGIETGDIVTTSYDTGPYVVTHISYRPQEQTVSLVCAPAPDHYLYRRPDDFGKPHKFYLNGIRLENGRYLFYGHDELFVQKPAQRPAQQLDMFNSFLE